MRVIAGSKRHTNLVTPRGDNTRPTTDRIKETLFNMIGPGLCDSYFLDVFSGSGQIAIEALSRGASRAYLIERDNNALACIKDNLKKCKFENDASVFSSDYKVALNSIKDVVFDYVFMDPPYDNLIEKDVLAILSESSIIDENTIIIVEASIDTDFSYLEDFGFTLVKEKKYKTNKHMFISKKDK